MEYKGNIRRIVTAKNFGFIEADGKDNIFFHKEDMLDFNLYGYLKEGDPVKFLLDQTSKGPRARNVELINERTI